jgi:hypothetical protein
VQNQLNFNQSELMKEEGSGVGDIVIVSVNIITLHSSTV